MKISDFAASSILLLDNSGGFDTLYVRHRYQETFERYTSDAPSRSLLETIGRILAERSLRFDDLDLIVAGNGPGSFTGIRVVLSTARVMAQVLQIPLFTISSLRLAYYLYDEEQNRDILLPFWDARKGRVFAAGYLEESEVIPAGDYTPQELLGQLQLARAEGKGVRCVTPDQTIWANPRASHLHPLKPLTYSLEARPFTFSSKLLGWLYLQDQEYCNYEEAMPLYLRDADAVIFRS